MAFDGTGSIVAAPRQGTDMEDTLGESGQRTLAPVESGERIHALDVVRGVALVGIFLMNVEFFNRPIADLAEVYLNWGGYAYGQGAEGLPARAQFIERLQQLQAVLHNQDNREHDILDSNDYYQFQGGMLAAVETLRGGKAASYFGDSSQPDNPRIRTLKEELGRVVRARAVNPKWIAGMKRHGYKGAFELAATVDYLFGFDATSELVDDHQYALLANVAIILLGGYDSAWTWIVVVLYFTTCHSTLIFCGAIGLSRALAGKPFRFPLIGPR